MNERIAVAVVRDADHLDCAVIEKTDLGVRLLGATEAAFRSGQSLVNALRALLVAAEVQSDCMICHVHFFCRGHHETDQDIAGALQAIGVTGTGTLIDRGNAFKLATWCATDESA